MERFVAGESRDQSTLFPERLDEYIAEDNPGRVIDAFVDELKLGDPGFERIVPQVTGRPSYHPATLLKIYVYGYLNRLQASRRLERKTQRNVELMWLSERLMTDLIMGLIPAVEIAAADLDLTECPAHRQLRLLDQPDDGQFLGCRAHH